MDDGNKVVNELALEPSTHTHKLSGKIVEQEEFENPAGSIKLKIEGEGLVTHGEHGSILTESENVIKLNQQEVNPVENELQPAYD